jgi:uncharacterized iron-regulated membrane protein
MTPFKKAMLFIHRWLGFIAGLVVFIVSITGCIFCFQDEIQDAIHDYRKVAIEPKPYLNPSQLNAIALKQVPGGKLGGVGYYGADRPATVRVSKDKVFHFLSINQYNGKVLHDENPRENFFIVVEFIHLYLLLPPAVGKIVVGSSTLIFVILMITGIILWWPKRKTDRKRSLTIKWNGRWRRVNYDLHNVLGFYATAIAIILGITGMSMSFEWMNNGLYKAANLGTAHPEEKIEHHSDSLNAVKATAIIPVNIAYEYAKKHSLQANMYLIFEGAKADGTLHVSAYEKSMRFAFSDFYEFDKYTGKLLNYTPHAKKSAGMKLNNMNYDIHVGQIGGLTTKIIAFLASLISASLPVTGFIIWLGKRKKKMKTSPKAIAHKKSRQHLGAARFKSES